MRLRRRRRARRCSGRCLSPPPPTEGVWKGQEDGANALSGRAAEYTKNNWSRGNGVWNPSQMKRQLLEELNSNDSADSHVVA
jgi:hypothetical protein